jgi:hypothetical protein
MKHINLLQLLRMAVCALAMTVATQASASLYQVRLDTSTLAGNGWLDLQFNPGPNAAPAASAVLSSFTGALNGAALFEGAVSGALPGMVVFRNSTSYNDLFQPIMLGGVFNFRLTFDGPFATEISDVGSTFALSLYAADQMTLLGNPDDTGSLLRFELLPASVTGPGSLMVMVADPAIASASAIPEPTTLLMITLGLVAMGYTGRRSRGN